MLVTEKSFPLTVIVEGISRTTALSEYPFTEAVPSDVSYSYFIPSSVISPVSAFAVSAAKSSKEMVIRMQNMLLRIVFLFFIVFVSFDTWFWQAACLRADNLFSVLFSFAFACNYLFILLYDRFPCFSRTEPVL